MAVRLSRQKLILGQMPPPFPSSPWPPPSLHSLGDVHLPDPGAVDLAPVPEGHLLCGPGGGEVDHEGAPFLRA